MLGPVKQVVRKPWQFWTIIRYPLSRTVLAFLTACCDQWCQKLLIGRERDHRPFGLCQLFSDCVAKQSSGKFSGTFFTETILTITEKVVGFKIIIHLLMHTFLQNFREYRKHRYWSIIFNKFSFSWFEYWKYFGNFPAIWDSGSFQGFIDDKWYGWSNSSFSTKTDDT